MNVKTIIVVVLSFLTSRYTLQLLGVEGYGLYYLIAGVTGTFEFLCSSMLGTTSRFTTLAEGKHDVSYSRKVFNTLCYNNNRITLWILSIIEVFGLMMIFFILKVPQDQLNVAVVIYQIMVVDTYFKLKVIPYNSLLIAKENFLFMNCVTIGQSVLKLVSVLLLFLLAEKYRIVAYAFAVMAVSFLGRSIIIRCVNGKYSETEKDIGLVDNDLRADIFSYLKYSWIGSVASIIKSQGANLLLNIFTGLTTYNAAFAVSRQITSVNDMAFGTTVQALLPQTLKSYSEKDFVRFKRMTLFNSKLGVILSYLIIIPLFVEVDFVFGIWLVETPEFAVEMARIVLVSELIRQMYNGLGMSTVVSDKVKKVYLFQTIVQATVFLATVVVLMINRNTIFVVLYAEIVVSLLNLVLNIAFSHRNINFNAVDYCKKVMLPSVVCIMVFLSLFYYIKRLLVFTIVTHFIYIFLMVVLLMAYFYFIMLSVEERKSIKRLIMSFVQKHAIKK